MIKFDRGNGWIANWWWTVDKSIAFVTFGIIAIGLWLVMAASPAVAERLGFPSFHFVIKQIGFVAVSIGVIFAISTQDHVFVRRFAVLGLLGTFIMLIWVHFAGHETKGAKLWINIAGITLQPSEFVKPFLAVVTAWLLSRSHTEANFPGFLIAVILYALFIGLIVKQPDFGMAAVVTAIWGTQVFVAGLNMVIVVVLGGLAVLGMIAAYMFVPHVRNRIDIYLDPTKGDSFQNQKSLEAFKNGGLFGTGPGQGEVKNIIPDCHTDFIFSVAGEELGMIASMIIVALFAFIVFKCFSKIVKEKDLFKLLAGTGLVMQFAVQSVINVSVSLSLIPNTGLTLPLVSYGGSATLSAAICVGMLLALTRKKYGEE